ncbi:MAG TPA: hypothetical protein PKO06_15145 [Candidatus Ozemobacteraceae bacterium]|nr:hypothetical protein [Candidatus Ozemobacteraceae bacterium]
MIRVLTLWCAFMLVLQTSVVNAGSALRLAYGKGAGQVSFFNPSVTQNYEEATPLGPMTFRRHGETFWVADSIAGRVLCVSEIGKVLHSLTIPGVPDNTLLEDLALVPGPDGRIRSVYVADGADLIVRQIEVASGKELGRFGGRGERPGQFLQIHQLEVGPSGRIYVGDYGRRVVAVFEPDGKLVRELPWQLTGFLVTEQDGLIMITHTDNAGFFLKEYDTAGQPVRSVHLGQSGSMNARIWGQAAEGGYWVTLTPASGFKGYLQLVRFSHFGAVAEKRLIRPVLGMNRFLDLTSGRDLWLARADYGAAPRGAFIIEALTREEKK